MHGRDAFQQPVDLFGAVVEIETGPCAGGDAQECVQRLRAVVSCPDCYAKPIVQDLSEFVGVDPLECETHQRGPMFRRGTEDPQAWHLTECIIRVANQELFVTVSPSGLSHRGKARRQPMVTAVGTSEPTKAPAGPNAWEGSVA